jgi:DivIVA domain-containing protein
MEVTPSQISGAKFRTVRKGYDPAEVDALLGEAAEALEQAQQQATAMEARARAAVARLQEQVGSDSSAPPPATDPSTQTPHLTTDDADSISRTLLLAQHTADRTVAEAEAEAERIREGARAEADETLDSTREMSAQMVEDARAEGRRLTDSDRIAAIDEVERLKARREFLLGDVDQRDRLRSAASEIEALVERVPSGLGAVNPPPMSASDDADEAAADAERSDDESADQGPADFAEFGRDDIDELTYDEADPTPLAAPDRPAALFGDELDKRVPAPQTTQHDVALPPEALMPFADASQLARALDDAQVSGDEPGLVPDGSGDVGPVDTSELDVTQVMESLDLPAPDDETGELERPAWSDGNTDSLGLRNRPSD